MIVEMVNIFSSSGASLEYDLVEFLKYYKYVSGCSYYNDRAEISNRPSICDFLFYRRRVFQILLAP